MHNSNERYIQSESNKQPVNVILPDSPWVQKEKDLDLKKEKKFGPKEKKSAHTPMGQKRPPLTHLRGSTW